MHFLNLKNAVTKIEEKTHFYPGSWIIFGWIGLCWVGMEISEHYSAKSTTGICVLLRRLNGPSFQGNIDDCSGMSPVISNAVLFSSPMLPLLPFLQPPPHPHPHHQLQ